MQQDTKRGMRSRYLKRHWELYAMLVLPVAFIIVFNYIPMGGVVMAFKDFKLRKGIFGSPWAANDGMANFIRFFSNYNFISTLRNTLVLSVYSLLVNIPTAVFLAISLNYVRRTAFKKTVQMVSYFPYFISTIVIASMVNMLFNTRTGVLGRIYYAVTASNILADPKMFPHLYVWSGVWQGVGFGAIIYLAALTNVPPELYEAAAIDGAGKLKRIIHITLPSIIPTIITMLIINMGKVMEIGFDQVYTMQNDVVYNVSEVISTYVYKIGLGRGQFSLSTAMGLFESIVSLTLVLITNAIAKRFDKGLW